MVFVVFLVHWSVPDAPLGNMKYYRTYTDEGSITYITPHIRQKNNDQHSMPSLTKICSAAHWHATGQSWKLEARSERDDVRDVPGTQFISG